MQWNITKFDIIMKKKENDKWHLNGFTNTNLKGEVCLFSHQNFDTERPGLSYFTKPM